MPHRSEQRTLAKSLYLRGIRNPYVLYKVWHIPYATAWRYVQRLDAGESLDDRTRSGRPRKLTSTLKRRLAQIKSRHPKEAAASYARRLRKTTGAKISERSVRNALHELRYHWKLRPRRKLTPAQKRDRLAFAQAHRYESWASRWFFDECYFNLYRHGKRYWVKVGTDDSFSLPKLTGKQEKVSVGIAVAICHGRKSALTFLPKNWSAPDLIRVFEDELLPSMAWSSRLGNSNELVCDNDGRHRQAEWLQFVERKRLRPIRPWPANSPDFNCIENVFAWLKARVEDEEPRDEASLREAIQRAWQAFPLSMTETLVESMPRRLADAVRLSGGRTKY